MCGRYSITTPTEQLIARFDTEMSVEALPPRYNAAPTQSLPVILNQEPRRIELLQWGLIPHWANDPSIGSRMINARAETLTDKPSYREPFQKRRCLVLADGFYEWQKTGSGKTPMRIALKSGEPFAFAGLWATWKNPQGQLVRSFSIITTKPNALVAPIHDRMPVMLQPEDEALWLDNSAGPNDWKELLRPYPAELLTSHAVSERINSPRNDDAAVVAPV
jgi:putative SOS response-associated peptidase YedK